MAYLIIIAFHTCSKTIPDVRRQMRCSSRGNALERSGASCISLPPFPEYISALVNFSKEAIKSPLEPISWSILSACCELSMIPLKFQRVSFIIASFLIRNDMLVSSPTLMSYFLKFSNDSRASSSEKRLSEPFPDSQPECTPEWVLSKHTSSN